MAVTRLEKTQGVSGPHPQRPREAGGLPQGGGPRVRDRSLKQQKGTTDEASEPRSVPTPLSKSRVGRKKRKKEETKLEARVLGKIGEAYYARCPPTNWLRMLLLSIRKSASCDQKVRPWPFIIAFM